MMLTIRAAQGDETALAALICHDVWHETQAHLQDQAVAKLRAPRFFSDRIDALQNLPLLAFAEEHPAGMAAWEGEDVLQVFVLPHWRGFGVGRRLLVACEEVMADFGIRRARLDCVCGDSAARQFYENCNWTLTGLNSRSVESARGPVKVLHWEFHKHLNQRIMADRAVNGRGNSG